MTRAGRWCNGQHATPVGGDPGSNPVASAKESASDTVCGFLFAVLAQRLVPQSSKLITRVRFPYTARYDSMPVGSSRRDVMTMRFVSDDPRLRLFDGHADYRRRPSFQDDANSPPSEGPARIRSAHPPSADRVS